jgi:hypothetical protein
MWHQQKPWVTGYKALMASSPATVTERGMCACEVLTNDVSK